MNKYNSQVKEAMCKKKSGNLHSISMPPTDLKSLRRQIEYLERSNFEKKSHLGTPLTTGIEEIDKFLPACGLRHGALHEFYGQGIAVAGFITVLVAHTAATENGVVLWCRDGLELYPPGLAFLGLNPERLILVNNRNSRNLLWAMEEGLRSGTPLVVVGEIKRASLTSLRRLQLAAETGGVAALLICPGKAAASSPAATRWHITAQSSSGKLPGTAWEIELLRARGGVPGKWELE